MMSKREHVQLPESARDVLISLNPKAGRKSPRQRGEELRDRLIAKGFTVKLGTDLTELTEEAKELHQSGRLRALIGVGGDGTAAELVNRTEPGTPIALLAAGTANLLSKHFRWGGTPRRLSNIIEEGRLLTLDAGRASGRLFLVMIGCGFDAYTVQQVHAQREENYRKGAKKGAHISYLSYMKPLWNAFWGYKFPKMRIEVFEDPSEEPCSIHENACWSFIFNLNRYGWGIPLAPGAQGTDGLLDLCMMKKGSIFHGLKYTAFAQCFGLHRQLPDVVIQQGKRFRITSDEPVPYQLDGDPGGVLPVDIEVVKQRLTLIVPENARS